MHRNEIYSNHWRTHPQRHCLGLVCQEQYCVSCVVSLDANKSMLSSGNSGKISVNTFLFNIHSCLSEKERDLKSASTFNFPAMCTT